MTAIATSNITADFFEHIQNKAFPCIAAKAALAKEEMQCMVAGHMACPKDDTAILQFLYNFIDHYRQSATGYHSAAILFNAPQQLTEPMFESMLWQRLQSLATLDAQQYPYDHRVSADPNNASFSFSLKEEAFFIIGMHPGSSRLARQFRYPALVFNPHAQFERLKETTRYAYMQQSVRKRDLEYSGSVNPMLQDFGEASEVYQYSGMQYDNSWKCPLNIQHANNERYSTP